MVEGARNSVEELMEAVWQEENMLGKPADFTAPEELYRNLRKLILKYHPSSDLSMIENAYHFAKAAHAGQKRKSGEPYIIHPLCVATILAELKLDKETVSAGLLHDVVEDTDVTLLDITEVFGGEVAFLVDGVTKLGQLPKTFDKTQEQAENLKKMFVAMAKDIRVILIKLADRLHNVRTLCYRKPEKQIKVARETMDIYAPLAQRLGISKIKVELDDLSLRYLRPEIYSDLARKLLDTKDEREQFMNAICQELEELLSSQGIQAEVSSHVKHLFSIYRRMVNQNRDFSQMEDVFTIRIIVNSIQECYEVLGVIHDQYKLVLERFKDYIAIPKSNKYQSIHTTLLSKSGNLFDVQIRTKEMHLTSEYGITAFWKYQEGGKKNNQALHKEEKLSWLRRILEWQQDLSDNKEFMSLLKNEFNLLTSQIYCFTPSGDVKNLPNGSNVIDFAYSIHAAVGNKMVGARANNQTVSFDYRIQNGDQIEIITSQNSTGPNLSWANTAKTTQARNKILSWFREDQVEENIKRGKELLFSYVKKNNVETEVFFKRQIRNKVIKKCGFRDWNGLLAAIGHGALKEGCVISRFFEEQDKESNNITDKQENMARGIIIREVNHPLIKFAKCCCPVPYDEIVGYMTTGRGVTIHRTDCENIIRLQESDRANLIQVEWQEEIKPEFQKSYMADIKITAKKRIGMIADISEILFYNDIEVDVLTSKVIDMNMCEIKLSFLVVGRGQLETVMKQLGAIQDIVKIERALL